MGLLQHCARLYLALPWSAMIYPICFVHFNMYMYNMYRQNHSYSPFWLAPAVMIMFKIMVIILTIMMIMVDHDDKDENSDDNNNEDDHDYGDLVHNNNYQRHHHHPHHTMVLHHHHHHLFHHHHWLHDGCEGCGTTSTDCKHWV